MSVSWATGETDTIEDDFPDSCDKSATNRNDEERVSRAAGEADDAEGRFERLLRAANNHQAEMKDPGGNEYAPRATNNGTRIIKNSGRIPPPIICNIGFSWLPSKWAEPSKKL